MLSALNNKYTKIILKCSCRVVKKISNKFYRITQTINIFWVIFASIAIVQIFIRCKRRQETVAMPIIIQSETQNWATIFFGIQLMAIHVLAF